MLSFSIRLILYRITIPNGLQGIFCSIDVFCWPGYHRLMYLYALKFITFWTNVSVPINNRKVAHENCSACCQMYFKSLVTPLRTTLGVTKSIVSCPEVEPLWLHLEIAICVLRRLCVCSVYKVVLLPANVTMLYKWLLGNSVCSTWRSYQEQKFHFMKNGVISICYLGVRVMYELYVVRVVHNTNFHVM